MESNDGVGACCGNLYDFNMNPVTSFSKLNPTVFNNIYIQYYYIIYIIIVKIFRLKLNIYNFFNYTDKIKDIGYISGADMFIRSEVFKLSGLFDERIFMYGDDVDLSCRIKKAGFRLKSIPQAKIIHLESKSINGNKKYRTCLNGEYKFYLKTYGRVTYIIYINRQFLDFLRMIVRFILPNFVLKKYFFGSSDFKFYQERIAVNKIEYYNAKKTYLNVNS